MGLSLPLLSKAINRSHKEAATVIGWLYGINTLGSGLGTFISGWYIVGNLGYEGTVYLGAIFSGFVGLIGLIISKQFESQSFSLKQEASLPHLTANTRKTSIKEWYLLVFISGFAAISWEIIWFRVLDVALQSNAYTYAHLLTFILVGNGLGSILGAKAVRYIRQPKTVFLLIQGIVSLSKAAVVVLSFPDLKLQESAISHCQTTFPYVPGFLSFREVPVVLEALKKLTIIPDLVLCDGQGIAHPKRFGLACHLGLLTDLPTIGVAKSRFIGTHEELPPEKGNWQPLIDRGEIIGAVVRSRTNVKPIYVSIGHKISLETAIDFVFRCLSQYRLPETTRLADRIASDRGSF